MRLRKVYIVDHPDTWTGPYADLADANEAALLSGGTVSEAWLATEDGATGYLVGHGARVRVLKGVPA